MFLPRILVVAAMAAATLAHAQASPPRPGYLGLQVGPSVMQLTCGRPAFACERAWTSTTPSLQVGVRWDFSRRGRATFGLDSFEQPQPGGRTERVRAATVGVQWQY